jgi:cell wall assembly regulator SMI1
VSIERVLAWSDAKLPVLRESLRRGVSEAEIAAAQEKLGAELPSDVVELYRAYDGQVELHDRRGLFYGVRWMPLSEVLAAWENWVDLGTRDPGLVDDCAEFMKSDPPGAIEPIYINRGWIPFTADGSGNNLGIDLAPGPKGTRGQVIIFGRDENEKFLVAPSLSAFTSWYADQLESGKFFVELDEDEDVDGDPMPVIVETFGRDEKSVHLHDLLRGLRREGVLP